jgi:hypothetical protein
LFTFIRFFSRSGFGILTSSAGAKLRWWIDPMGAIIISLLIIYSWTLTAYGVFFHPILQYIILDIPLTIL